MAIVFIIQFKTIRTTAVKPNARMKLSVLFVFFCCAQIVTPAVQECNLPEKLKTEIRGYQDVVNKIISAAVGGEYSGVFYNDLADFVDTFGNRMTGMYSTCICNIK